MINISITVTIRAKKATFVNDKKIKPLKLVMILYSECMVCPHPTFKIYLSYYNSRLSYCDSSSLPPPPAPPMPSPSHCLLFHVCIYICVCMCLHLHECQNAMCTYVCARCSNVQIIKFVVFFFLNVTIDQWTNMPHTINMYAFKRKKNEKKNSQ